MTVAAGQALWTGRPQDVTIDQPVGVLLRRRAGASPASPAVMVMAEDGSTEALTYGELLASAARVAGGLLALAPPGRTVAVCAANSMEWVLLEYATALAGMVLVPINPAMAAAEFGHILDLTDPAVVLCDPSYRDRPLYDEFDALLASRQGVLRPLGAWVRDASGDGVLPDVGADDPLLIQYTSGTTGRPKGALHTHRSALNCTALWCADWGHAASDVFALPIPLHHVGGSITGVLAGLTTGSAVALLVRYRPELFLRLLVESRATVTGGVPTMLLDLQAQPGFDADTLRAVRIVAGGGAAVPPSVVREIESLLGATFVVVYGQSESPAILATPPSASLERRASSLGRPLPGRDVRIRRPDGSTAGLGEVGEIVTRSPMTMREYYRQPAQTAAVVDEAGWLGTGDLGAMDSEGYVSFHGRSRDVIIRGGENLYPAEIEGVFQAHPAVASVAIVGRPDRRMGEVPVGFAVLAEGATVEVAELEAFGRSQLAAFKIPREWHFLPGFPMTASGKVRKVDLRALLVDSESAG